MRPWTFREYVSEAKANGFPFCRIADWYGKQDAVVQNAFDITKRLLVGAGDDWLDPERQEFARLEEPHLPLCEMRFRADVLDKRGRIVEKRRVRPVGFYRPGPEFRDFILFGAAIKYQGGHVYVPTTAFDDALGDYHDWLAGKGVLREHF